MWGNMYFGISQALAFGIAGIPYFGVETCGFNGNADMELCTRWMQLSAWFPFYVSEHKSSLPYRFERNQRLTTTHSETTTTATPSPKKPTAGPTRPNPHAAS
jgi:alpha-glucosidase (family GH31 glycosyl hydrolase)